MPRKSVGPVMSIGARNGNGEVQEPVHLVGENPGLKSLWLRDALRGEEEEEEEQVLLWDHVQHSCECAPMEVPIASLMKCPFSYLLNMLPLFEPVILTRRKKDTSKRWSQSQWLCKNGISKQPSGDYGHSYSL